MKEIMSEVEVAAFSVSLPVRDIDASCEFDCLYGILLRQASRLVRVLLREDWNNPRSCVDQLESDHSVQITHSPKAKPTADQTRPSCSSSDLSSTHLTCFKGKT